VILIPEVRLSRSTLFVYAAPAATLALPTIPLIVHLPALYGDTLGLGLTTAGLVLLAARLFDTVTDPLIGYLSDRFAYRGARRKPWIAVGALIAGPSLYCLLAPPAGIGALYLLGWSVALSIGWTLISVPYMAWGAELTGNYNERTRITSWRESAGLIGIVAAGCVGMTGGDSTERIAGLAILLGGFLLPLLLWRVPDSGFRGRTRVTGSGAPLRGRLRREIASVACNWPFLRLMTAWFLNGLANGIPAALFFFYLEYGLGADADERSLFIAGYFVAAIAAMPMWAWVNHRAGKHRTWCVAMGLACAAFMTVPLLPMGSLVAFGAVCLITGMALGADLALPPAIQADVVDYGALKDGVARAGTLFALWAMSTKLALALAVGIALPAVELLGFDPSVPTEAGRIALTVIYALVPVVIKVIAILVVWRFPLTDRRMTIVQRRLGALAS